MTDIFVLNSMLKASAHTDGKDRFIFMEASNEGVDLQDEIIRCSALKESADYFLKFGNIDIDHFTLLGPKSGTTDYQLFEIGRPVSVDFRGNRTFVKAKLFTGKGKAVEKADYLWDTMTSIDPPVHWYPSVGGAFLERTRTINPDTGKQVTIATKVRWSNIGLSRTPVNPNVPTAGITPINGVLAKSLGAIIIPDSGGLAAGYGSDSADLSGGDALRKQSLSGGKSKIQDYFSFRDKISDCCLAGGVGELLTIEDLENLAIKKFDISAELAKSWVHRFCSDISKI